MTGNYPIPSLRMLTVKSEDRTTRSMTDPIKKHSRYMLEVL